MVAIVIMIVGFALSGLEGFLSFFRRRYPGGGDILLFPNLRHRSLPVGHLAHRPARRRLERRRIFLDHLRVLRGRAFGLAFLLLLIVILCAGKLVAERTGAVEGAFLVMQPFDTLGDGRGPVGHMPWIIPQMGLRNAAGKEKGGVP